MIHTPLCDLLGIRYPVFQGGMAWIADGKLAAAVSEGGGLGIIAAGNAPAEALREQIQIAKSLTKKPFGVNIMLMSPFVEEVAQLVAEEKVAVVTTGAGNPSKYMALWKEAGIKVIPVVASVAMAKLMTRLGASALIAEGGESGGHVGELTTMVLVPQVCDATSLPVIAAVELLPNTTEIRISGGKGVGRVTKAGLDQPVGEAAINHVPRQMIAEALQREAESACYTGGFAVTISIEGGEEVAKRTFNPHIGVEGGLSVLGTSGIVEPMSQQAILDTIQLEMNQAALRAGSPRRLILAPGNYGLDYLHERYPEFHAVPVVKTSNFIGDTLDMAAAARFEEVLLVGHVGKLVKVAGGIMNTHSHTADCRTELFCTHAALCGASREVCAALMNAATTDACLELLDSAGLRAPVLESLLRAVQLHLDRRACGAFRVGAVLFSNQHGPLGATDTAAQLLNEWKEH